MPMYLVGGIFSGDWAQNRARELVELSSMVCVVLFILDADGDDFVFEFP